MAPDPTSPPPAVSAADWTLLCPACRRAAGYTDAGLYALFWDGWPDCCGQRMVLQPEEGAGLEREAG